MVIHSPLLLLQPELLLEQLRVTQELKLLLHHVVHVVRGLLDVVALVRVLQQVLLLRALHGIR
jgi:hypothetical protein